MQAWTKTQRPEYYLIIFQNNEDSQVKSDYVIRATLTTRLNIQKVQKSLQFSQGAGTHFSIIISGKMVESAGMATSRAICSISAMRKGTTPR